jgi:hypothetical protein
MRRVGRTAWRQTGVGCLAGLVLLAVASAPAGAAATARSKAAKRIARAANEVAGQKSYRVDGSMTLKIDGGMSARFPVSGSIDTVDDAADLTYDFSDLGVDGVGRVHVLYVGGVEYLPASFFAGKVPSDELDGKRWVSVADPTRGSGADDGVGSSNPTGLLDALRGVSDDVQTVGTETVRGVATTHYHADVNLARAVGRAPTAQRAKVRKEIAALGKGTATVEVWLDADNLPRRLAMTADVPGASDHPGVSATIRVDEFDYGVDVHVSVPPREEVVPSSELHGTAIAST